MIKHSLGKEIGKFPQVSEINNTRCITIAYMSEDELIENNNHGTQEFMTSGGAKLTNVLSTGFLRPKFLLLSNILFEELKQFRIPDYCFWETNIIHRKKNYCYKVLFDKKFHNSYIDFAQSEFVYMENNEGKPLKINSLDHYNKISVEWDNKMRIKPTKLVFSDNIPYDIFRIFIGSLRTYIVNEIIKSKLEKDFTGALLENCEKINYF